MRLNNLINDKSSELIYVDLKNESIYTKNENDGRIKLRNLIKFNFKLIDTYFYKNEIILAIISLFISVVSIFLGDFLSILNPIFMICFITLLSSNPIAITNSRYLDVGIWNLINSFGIIIKSLNLTKISAEYEELTDFFTKIFLCSLILSGIPAFNLVFILITIALIFSHVLCFINKNVKCIKESISIIESKYLYYTIISFIVFSIFFKGSSINLTAFTIILCFKYFNNCIKDYDINTIKDAEN